AQVRGWADRRVRPRVRAGRVLRGHRVDDARRAGGRHLTGVTTTEEPAELTGGQMSLIEHLNELRSRLIKCILAVAVGAVVVWIFYNPLFRWLIEPLERACDNTKVDCEIITT